MSVHVLIAQLAVSLLASFGLTLGDGIPASTFYIGTGRYDITGPAAQIEMMGYAMPSQIGNGIHLRQFSRAFIFADAENKSRVVFVNADICMGSQIMKIQVIDKLQKIYGKDLYTHDNVLISGIHTHSGPAGYFQYVLFEVMSLGFVGQALDAIVDGIVQSIQIAHGNMKKGTLSLGTGFLYDASINRSPSAYLHNPESERKKYANNTDKGMVVLKMMDSTGAGIGMLNWFAVHCTSMNVTNRLVSSDNKGLASLMMERDMNSASDLPGRGKFVAAFAQSNEGDVSPNTNGSHCLDTGGKCDFYHSTCHGKNELCVAPGPGKDMFDSTRIIATKQYEAGKKIYASASTAVHGPVKYVYTNVDFSNVTIPIPGSTVHTCPPAMGRSFAAGTTDGPGAFNFEQGDTNSSNPFWNTIRNFIKTPSKEQVKCHAPKPILLDTGEMNFPYPWQGKILPLQLFQIGQLVIVGVPAEFTTMSGRRTRTAIKNALLSHHFTTDAVVVIAGLSNTYSDYVVTYEEYQIQRYEGASTVYGPHTLAAYIQEFTKLAIALATDASVQPGPSFPNYRSKQIGFHLPIVFDAAPSGKEFGSVKTDVNGTYKVSETVRVEFWAGNPRNNLMTNNTFLTVQLKESSSGNWNTLYTDASWETKFSWEQTSTLEGHSEATITWDIPPSAAKGVYRIQHFGYHKPLTSVAKPYNGTSSEFKVV